MDYNNEQHQCERIDSNNANKASVFDALSGAGITSVIVNFDRYGDSGQIDSVTAHAGDKVAELPVLTVAFYESSWDDKQPTLKEIALPEAIETLCYDFLEREHPGWEIDDGSDGQFEFNTGDRIISLGINRKYSEYFEEEL